MSTQEHEQSWFESGEDYVFQKPQDITDTLALKDVTLAKLAAFVSAAGGIRTRGEIYSAVGSHVVYAYLFGQSGIDGIYSYLAGVHLAKKRFRWASVPLLVDAFESINQYRRTKSIALDTYAKNGILATGFLLAYFKII